MQTSPSAVTGNLRLSPDAESLGGGRQQWHVPPRDARTHGVTKRRPCSRLGFESGKADHDSVSAACQISSCKRCLEPLAQIRHQQHSNPRRSQGVDRGHRKLSSCEVLERARCPVIYLIWQSRVVYCEIRKKRLRRSCEIRTYKL